MGLAAPARAETLRIATFNVELSRAGPGLLLRDLRKGDEQAALVAGIIARVAPDVLVLQGVDYDYDGLALSALAGLIGAAGHPLPHHFALRPNTGRATGQDMDGNGRLGEPRDAQGFGRFAGQGGMAVLSALPIDTAASRDFSGLLWRDLPGAIPPRDSPGLSVQRLASVAHWDVALRLPDGTALHLLTWHATPPVFDGPEDRNGRRNHDEAAFWLRYLDGALETAPPDSPFVIVGDANLDPVDGDGRPDALTLLLGDSRLQDPQPKSAGAPLAALRDGGVNAHHRGDPALDTVDWPDAREGDPGNLRVDYILPSAHWRVQRAGVFWPEPGDPLAALLGDGGTGASRHRLVWVDLALGG
ncbi:MAG: endonuclease/exonuclease/phosphatase family protein [Rhodobacterales bacterium]|nr:endonuclease/exonuclease/phosphatase family protein [Rhodobacterales bacterium]